MTPFTFMNLGTQMAFRKINDLLSKKNELMSILDKNEDNIFFNQFSPSLIWLGFTDEPKGINR